MYPLGKTMQLKLKLFKDSLDKYRRGLCLNQKALQTGEPRGTFKHGDAHPWVDGLFYLGWTTTNEQWRERKPKSSTIIVRQKELQTGKPRGTFKQGDKHPWAEGFFYRMWVDGERWNKLESIERDRKLWDERNKSEAGKLSVRKYSKTEKGKLLKLFHTNKYRAIKQEASANLTEYEEGITKQIYAHAVRVSAKLQIPFEVDHIVPLSKGGLHHPLNLQIAPATWNRRKRNRNTERWLPNGM